MIFVSRRARAGPKTKDHNKVSTTKRTFRIAPLASLRLSLRPISSRLPTMKSTSVRFSSFGSMSAMKFTFSDARLDLRLTSTIVCLCSGLRLLLPVGDFLGENRHTKVASLDAVGDAELQYLEDLFHSCAGL